MVPRRAHRRFTRRLNGTIRDIAAVIRDQRQGWRNATRVVLVMLAIALVVLATTGVWLWFRYVPTAEAATAHPVDDAPAARGRRGLR